MVEKAARAVAVVGVGAVLPDAPNADAYWENLTQGRYSISEVTPDRWDPALYYDPDPKAPDKTYSILGGWVRDVDWSPLEWRLPIPPKVSEAMDRTQKWSIVASREALLDYGYPERALDPDRTAVVLGNAMAGDMHYLTSLRAYFPEYAEELGRAPSFAALPPQAQEAIVAELRDGVRNRFPDITEDTMPGELANIIAGRVANLYNFHGPNFVVDAACASALAAIDAAIEGLEHGDYDAVLSGGIDANMGVPSFIKFCKIGALSATGTRPYHDGADGFVMGEGAAVMLLKRLEDAERDGDHIYAVIRGLGGSSDGKGKGITAPNPVGQEFAIARAWKNAGISPTSATYIEGHGTSTRVGDVVEVESLSRVFADLGLTAGSIPLGSVKSNIGHLKSSAGAAGMLKAIKALDQKVIPPSLGGSEGNPNIDFSKSPLYINRELAEWRTDPGLVRNAGVSAFGFGGTNFHVVLEEYIPGRLQVNGDRTFSMVTPAPATAVVGDDLKTPLRGALVTGGADEAAVVARLRTVHEAAGRGEAPPPAPPAEDDLRAAVRVAIDYGDAAELAKKSEKAIKAMESGNPMMWKPLANQGVFLGRGGPQMTAFLYTGQGSQYVNMLATLRVTEPIVGQIFDEADRVMEPILGKPLTDYIFVDGSDESAVAEADAQLRQTEITQPAVLAVDAALTKLMAAYGIFPDMVMGHSLGEYGALVASGAMPFEDALHAVAGRGREMANVSVADNGLMAAVFAPLDKIEAALEAVDGYVVIANINSTQQAVIGGGTNAVRQAMDLLSKGGAQVIPLPVSHAFHTEIVAPASEPLGRILTRLRLESPAIPLVANVDGEFYPMGPNVVTKMIEILEKQIASPVQFVKGLRTLYDAGCRVFVEMGPKKALQGMAADVLGDDPAVSTLYSNHPKQGDVVSFNQALCGMYAAGHGVGVRPQSAPASAAPPAVPPRPTIDTRPTEVATMTTPQTGDMYTDLGRLFADFLAKGYEIYSGAAPAAASAARVAPATPTGAELPVVVTGAGLGLPGGERVFGDDKVPAILQGQQFIDTIPVQYRKLIADKHITRLVKSEAGGGHFETIDSQADVIKLAGRGGTLDLVDEFGFPAERNDALDQASKLAIGAGLEALRDAGIPLAMHYKTTTTGSKLPERWMLPEAYRDTTGVIFASAFPGVDGMIEEVDRYWEDQVRQRRLDDLRSLLARLARPDADGPLGQELRHRIHELEAEGERNPYLFNRKFLFKAVSMGHAQFAEYIGARGPNTQINAACASTTQAVAIAEDWINAGRCERVVIISGDDVTSDNLIEWIGSGFLAVGAAATDEVVEEAALPFDRRRHGMILGMGAAAMVVESAESAATRGIRPIVEVLSAVTANSAFHGSRLDPSHIKHVMEDLVSRAERRWGVDRHQIAPRTVFISHETYTPARGGSAQAEVDALRFVFGDQADEIVVSNTKGFTGHAMGVGVEDVVAIKAVETGIVPPVPNFKEVDPDLGNLNLSQGGTYPIEYALRLGAGFGSQISLTLYRYVPTPSGARPEPDQLGFERRIEDESRWQRWLAEVTGIATPQLEVAQRTLRIADNGVPASAPTAPTSARPAVATSPEPVVASPPAAPAMAPAEKPDIGPETADVRPETADVRPETAAAVVAAGAPAADPVAERVLALVAEQTGYPADMLALDLDLEADLGIDTVKQAETFAAIREAYGIARDDSLALRDYPTLNDVIAFVYERAEGLQKPDVRPQTSDVGHETADVRPETADIRPETAAAVVAAGAPAADPVAERVLALVAEQTGYPPDMLDLELDLEADLGIDTVKQAETFAAIREAYGIARDDSLALRDYPTLNDVIAFVYERAEGLQKPDIRPQTSDVGHETADVRPETAEAAATASATAPGLDPVAAKVLEVVAEQTGYPPDMLDLDADLEADLGIDTVKQAETFAAIREAYGIARDDSLALRDYPTLNDVIAFVYERAEGLEKPDIRPQTAEATTDVRPQTAEAIADVRPRTSEAVAEPSTLISGDDDAAAAVPRRIPTAVLRPPLDLCVPTGVSLDEGSRVVVMLDDGGVGTALVDRLEKRGVAVLAIEGAPGVDELLDRIDEFARDAAVSGVYWLPALDVEPDISGMELADWREALRRRVKLLYATMRHLYDRGGEAGAFLVSATRLGGRHGYDAAGAVAPMGGAVTGFTKAYKREKPDALVKAVDFAPSRKTAALAEILIDETLRDPGAVEVGTADYRRWTIGLTEEPLTGDDAGIELGPDSVIVVTGAAGSIVSAITADLAKASGGAFHLLDLVEAPDPNDADVALFATDKDALKRAIFNRLKESGERATPALVDRQLAAIERRHAALAAVQSIEEAGGTVHYHSVNLLDGDAVRAAMEAAAATTGRIDLLLHAGGLEISRLLPDKEPGEYDLVFDVKADGWFNLLKGLGDAALGSTVVFSSVAGRFGNNGQTDYSAANDLLCKFTSHFKTSRPDTLGVALDWTAWGDIGMATRGSIPTVMKAAGIDMLPAAAGIPIVRREVTGRSETGEQVVGLRLGILLDEFHPTGGLDVGGDSSVSSQLGKGKVEVHGVAGFGIYDGLVVTAELNPAEQPFLYDHQIDGTPVLPGVMGMEAFAETAAFLFPELRVVAVEDVDFLAPFKFYRNEPRIITVAASFVADGDEIVARCRLIGERTLVGQDEPQRTTHFTGMVRLGTDSPDLGTTEVAPASEQAARPEEIYAIYFHGPAYQVLDAAWGVDGGVAGRMAAELPPNHVPAERSTVTHPRLAELAFQASGVWEIGTTGTMALPMHVGRVRFNGTPDKATGAITAMVQTGDDGFTVRVADESGATFLVMEGYRTVALPAPVAEDAVAPLRRALGEHD